MKKFALVLMLLTGMVVSGQSVQAQTNDSADFVVSIDIPIATSISIIATPVNAQSGQFGSPVTALDFNPVTLNQSLGVFFPDHYFAIDVGTSGGAGTPGVTVTYQEGSNPNSPNNGLGWKSTMTFVRVETNAEVPLAGHGPKKLLKDLAGETVAPAELTGGFLRMYVGLATLDPNATIPDPAGAEVFSLGDAGGSYDGLLTISATVS
ncbi:MAG: hypothetical protein KC684_02720 [Candidatus Omnitrophica bacterium]|nr:hypothetical protein [Candidatus Omnitrophota bacterium]